MAQPKGTAFWAPELAGRPLAEAQPHTRPAQPAVAPSKPVPCQPIKQLEHMLVPQHLWDPVATPPAGPAGFGSPFVAPFAPAHTPNVAPGFAPAFPPAVSPPAHTPAVAPGFAPYIIGPMPSQDDGTNKTRVDVIAFKVKRLDHTLAPGQVQEMSKVRQLEIANIRALVNILNSYDDKHEFHQFFDLCTELKKQYGVSPWLSDLAKAHSLLQEHGLKFLHAQKTRDPQMHAHFLRAYSALFDCANLACAVCLG